MDEFDLFNSTIVIFIKSCHELLDLCLVRFGLCDIVKHCFQLLLRNVALVIDVVFLKHRTQHQLFFVDNRLNMRRFNGAYTIFINFDQLPNDSCPGLVE